MIRLARNLQAFSIIVALGGFPARSVADRVVTVLADFEDESVAATIGDVQNIAPADCSAQITSIPARGTHSLQIDLGATQPSAAATCNFLFRTPKRFVNIDRAAAFCWIKGGNVSVGFRIRDASDNIFETALVPIKETNRWVHVSADNDPRTVKSLSAGAPQMKPPLQLQGVRVSTPDTGLQTVFIDEVQLEHQVPPEQVVLPDFIFSEPTRIYEPGGNVGASVQLENRSRDKPARVELELSWLKPDDSVLKTEQKTVSLGVSGADFRATQTIDFSQKIDDPGLYRLVAKLRGASPTPNIVETSIAVTPSNRLLPRGRTVLFGIYANLFREPVVDQSLEIAVARDLGVQLFALETPWSAVEPKAGTNDFRALDRLLAAIIAIDATPMLVITSPPTWLPSDAGAAQEALASFLEQISGHVGRKVPRYALSEAALAFTPGESRTTVIDALQKRIVAGNPDALLLPPPVAANNASSQATMIATAGNRAPASIAPAAPNPDAPPRYWLHAADPFLGPGYFADAEDVLRRYIAAASQGFTGLIWSDLRDDDNDPQRPEILHGLVRRDFSPRMPLIGYAAAASQLTGTRYAGPVHGAPPEFASAMFIGSGKQLAVLLPRANRILPGMLAPIRGVEGAFDLRDFERQPIKLLEFPGGNLAAASKRPIFITLKPKSAQPEPQIALGKPWLRFPATVYCADKAAFNIEVDAPANVKEGFVQLTVPANAGLASTFSARKIKTTAAETIAIPVELTRDVPVPQLTMLTLRVTLDKATFDTPIEVRPMLDLKPASAGEDLASPAHLLGTLQPAAAAHPTSSGSIYGGIDGGNVRLSIVVKDDKFVPAIAMNPGDRLLLGVAAVNSDAHNEWRISVDAKNVPRIENLVGDDKRTVAVVPVKGDPKAGESTRRYDIQIPVNSLKVALSGASSQPSQTPVGTIALLAARYEDDDGAGSPQILTWGSGLDGRRTAEDFNAVRISP